MIPKPSVSSIELIKRVTNIESKLDQIGPKILIQSGNVGWDYTEKYREEEFYLVKSGDAKSKFKINFDKSFTKKPIIHLGLTKIDANTGEANLRFMTCVDVKNLSKKGLTIKVKTKWADTILFRYNISWLAYTS